MTATSASPILLDTSVAVALVLADHEHHEAAMAALGARELGLAGHAAFETYSVFTRLPGRARRSPAAATRILMTDFPHTRFLSDSGAAALLESMATNGITGGSVYDALVGSAAREHDLTLTTLDRRALATYRKLGVEVELLS